jgi:hypothetical protein
MRPHFDELVIRLGSEDVLDKMPSAPALRPFSDEVVGFLNDLSAVLLRSASGYSDVVTFAFWCRRASVARMRESYLALDDRVGRGIVFHSTPSNVPVNFAFSLAAGLLAGNANIVRLPAKQFQQVEIITNAIDDLIRGSHAALAPYLCFVKYPPNQSVHDWFSSLCDTRVIWGGDETIREIRRSPLKPRANEIAFADRFSFSVIDADAWTSAENKDAVINDFYNDTYFSDQNACTAPRIVIWVGSGADEARQDFWARLNRLVHEKYTYMPVQAVGKFDAFCRLAADKPGVKLIADDTSLYRVELERLDPDIRRYAYNSGYFLEYEAASLDELLVMIDESCQTLSYYGCGDAVRAWIMDRVPHGIDRIVPLGRTMDFTLVWDGIDLIYALSRVVGYL